MWLWLLQWNFIMIFFKSQVVIKLCHIEILKGSSHALEYAISLRLCSCAQQGWHLKSLCPSKKTICWILLDNSIWKNVVLPHTDFEAPQKYKNKVFKLIKICVTWGVSGTTLCFFSSDAWCIILCAFVFVLRTSMYPW